MPGSAWTLRLRQQGQLALALCRVHRRQARLAGQDLLGLARRILGRRSGRAGLRRAQAVVRRQDQRRAADYLELVGRALAQAQILLDRAGAAAERQQRGAPGAIVACRVLA